MNICSCQVSIETYTNGSSNGGIEDSISALSTHSKINNKHSQMRCIQCDISHFYANIVQIHELITIILFSMKSIINIEYSINYWDWNRQYTVHCISMWSLMWCTPLTIGHCPHLFTLCIYRWSHLITEWQILWNLHLAQTIARFVESIECYGFMHKRMSINYFNCTQSIITQSSYVNLRNMNGQTMHWI